MPVCVSVQSVDGRWAVRWRDAFGRQRGRRFQTERDAKEFDAALHDVLQGERRGEGAARAGSVYAYSTASGTRWYFKTRGSNGAQLTRRGFSSQKSASDAKRRLVEQIERGEVRHTKRTFGEHWRIWLKRRKPRLQPGTWHSYETIGRKRLLPAFESLPLTGLSVERVHAWMAEQAQAVATGEIAPKTVNNMHGTLIACLNVAVHDGLIAFNPALVVERLPDRHIEREYLRLQEIPLYLDACNETYRPLAELLIGGGLRISEATALRMRDLELNDDGGTIVVYRPRRSGAEEPIDRVTISRDWYKHALQDAGPRDMPLHALRHAAAAAWLAAGNSLLYVQRQQGALQSPPARMARSRCEPRESDRTIAAAARGSQAAKHPGPGGARPRAPAGRRGDAEC